MTVGQPVVAWIPTKYSNPRQLVNEDTNATVAESQSRKQSSFFRSMSLEISETMSLAVDIILLTFVLAWSERQNERSKHKPPMLVWLSGSISEILEGYSAVTNPGTRRKAVPLFLIPPVVLSYRY